MAQVLPLVPPAVVAIEQSPVLPTLNNDGPVPMSFPAILRNPGVSDRFAHLRVAAERAEVAPPSTVPKSNRRDDKEGKRWVRRKENAHFVGNAHIVLPSKRDFAIPSPSPRATFPQPLPNYLSRNNVVPPAAVPTREPVSAHAGRFSMSLKGMRRELRKSGPRTELLVKEIEDELLRWLQEGGVLLSPDAEPELSFPGVEVGSTDAIREVSRTPLKLVWSIEDSAFTRYIVHCCARYHDVVSFSKNTSGQRLTFLLRPNVTRPDHVVRSSIETPPSTDLDSDFVSDSDLVSERDSVTDADSDMDGPTSVTAGAHLLAAIAEGSDASMPGSPVILPAVPTYASDDAWSVIGDTDVDVEDNEAEQGIAGGVRSLGLQDAERTPRAQSRLRQVSLRSHMWERQRRSASSPSRSPARSPARRMPPRVHARVELQPLELPTSGRSFYDYLFS